MAGANLYVRSGRCGRDGTVGDDLSLDDFDAFPSSCFMAMEFVLLLPGVVIPTSAFRDSGKSPSTLLHFGLLVDLESHLLIHSIVFLFCTEWQEDHVYVGIQPSFGYGAP